MSDTASSVVFSVRMAPELKVRLDARAEELQVSRNALITTLLVGGLAKPNGDVVDAGAAEKLEAGAIAGNIAGAVVSEGEVETVSRPAPSPSDAPSVGGGDAGVSSTQTSGSTQRASVTASDPRSLRCEHGKMRAMHLNTCPDCGMKRRDV